jgi:hypothetical protein
LPTRSIVCRNRMRLLCIKAIKFAQTGKSMPSDC